jgi:hypothetical protein
MCRRENARSWGRQETAPVRSVRLDVPLITATPFAQPLATVMASGNDNHAAPAHTMPPVLREDENVAGA